MNLADALPEEEKPGKRTRLIPRRARKPRPWVVDGVAMRGQLGILFGEPSAGKSLLSLHIAIMVASREEWGPFKLIESGPVLLVNREDDIEEIDRRTWAIEHTQPIPEEIPLEYLDRPSTHIVMRDKEGKLDKTAFYNELINHIREIGAKLVILDPLIELAGNLDENNNIEMNFLVEALRQIAIITDCAILAVHHTRKGATAGSMDGMRGASAIAGRVRCANQVVTLPEGHGFDVPEEKRKRYKGVLSAKQNYADATREDWLEIVAFRDEAINQWSPAMQHVVLSDSLDTPAVAEFLDGKRATFHGNSKVAAHRLVAERFDVKPAIAKAKIETMEREGKLTLEDKYDDTAKKRVPHFVNPNPAPF